MSTKPIKTSFDPADLAAIIADIDAEKPRKLTVRDAVHQMSSAIKSAKARGCTDDQLLALLAKHGISISANTLRAYIADAKPKTKPPARSSAAAATIALNNDATAGVQKSPPQAADAPGTGAGIPEEKINPVIE